MQGMEDTFFLFFFVEAPLLACVSQHVHMYTRIYLLILAFVHVTVSACV